MEQRQGGRWYGIGEDGSEWGEVLAWEPPTRVLLASRVGMNWQFDPNLLTEDDIRFAALGDHSTRTTSSIGCLKKMGDAAESARDVFESEAGWGSLLAAYRSTVDATP